MKPESYSVCGPQKGLTKSDAIWITEGGRTTVLMYLRRPKWIKDDNCWNEAVKSVRLNLTATEIK